MPVDCRKVVEDSKQRLPRILGASRRPHRLLEHGHDELEPLGG